MKVRTDLIPTARRRRSGRAFVGGRATSLTVHNTANPNATAAGHANWLKRPNATRGEASWHWTVDDTEAILHIPMNEQAWHAGTNAGNTTSLAVEVCEFTDPARQKAANDNAIALIAGLFEGEFAPGAEHLDATDLRTHKSWSGKNCPRLILPWWDEFVSLVSGTKPTPKPAPRPIVWEKAPKPKPKEDDIVSKLPTVNLSRVTRLANTWIRGRDVSTIQGLLVARGRAPANTIRNGRVDGIGGPGTKVAVEAFQRAQRITVDGIVGPQTWAKLLGV